MLPPGALTPKDLPPIGGSSTLVTGGTERTTPAIFPGIPRGNNEDAKENEGRVTEVVGCGAVACSY